MKKSDKTTCHYYYRVRKKSYDPISEKEYAGFQV